jgi:hypothetical protein
MKVVCLDFASFGQTRIARFVRAALASLTCVVLAQSPITAQTPGTAQTVGTPAASEKIYTVNELIAELDTLQGKDVSVRGWLDECIGDLCTLLPRSPSAADRLAPPDARPKGLMVGRLKEFDLSANLHRFQGVILKARVLGRCGDGPNCGDRAGDILPLAPPVIVEKLTTRQGWPAAFRGGLLQQLDAVTDPALTLAVRRTLDDIVSREVARIERAFLRYDPSRRVSYNGKPSLREDDLLRLAAVLVEGPNPPAEVLAEGRAARMEIQLYRDLETDGPLAQSLSADAVATACICLKTRCEVSDWPRDLSELLHNRANPYLCLDAAKRNGVWAVSPY